MAYYAIGAGGIEHIIYQLRERWRCFIHIWNIAYHITCMNLKLYEIQITMLERPKISPSQPPKSLGISPSDLAFKSLGVKIENSLVTWMKNAQWLGLQDRNRKRAVIELFHIPPMCPMLHAQGFVKFPMILDIAVIYLDSNYQFTRIHPNYFTDVTEIVWLPGCHSRISGPWFNIKMSLPV